MQCSIRMHQQNITVVPMLRGQCNPGAGIDTEQMALQLVSTCQSFEELRALALNVGFIRLRQYDDKFIATQAGADIAITQITAQAMGDVT